MLGWWIGEVFELVLEGNVSIVYYGGIIMGFIILLILFFEYKVSIVMMVNCSGSFGELFKLIFNLVKVILLVKVVM